MNTYQNKKSINDDKSTNRYPRNVGFLFKTQH